MFLSFVIPTYNREANLRRVLSSLTFQTDRDFEVIVADDGSTDGTPALVREWAKKLPVKYFWHKHQDYRLALVRNMGAQLRANDATHIWFLDSDVILRQDAVALARKIVEEHPDAVLSGQYDWLNKYAWPYECGSDYWKLFSGLLFRPDHRVTRGLVFDDETVRTDYEGSVLGANILCPVKWLLKRGFDETIIGGGQDGEFSYYLQSQGAPVIFSSLIRGLHLWHTITPHPNTAAVKLIHERYLNA